MKTELNANKKMLASLEMCERECGKELQKVLDFLQQRIPLSVLLECVLERNANSTVKDLSGIINNVISTLQAEIKNYHHFVNIYRGDYNTALGRKVAVMKNPVKARFGVCVNCGDVIKEGEECRVYNCGHLCHLACIQSLPTTTNTSSVIDGMMKMNDEFEEEVGKEDYDGDGCQLCMNESEEVKKVS